MVRLFLITLAALLIAACDAPPSNTAPEPEPTLAWDEGGTLQDATLAQWTEADDRNRLATSAGWLRATDKVTDTTELQPASQELVDCINEAAPDFEPDTKITEIGATCILMLFP